MGRLRAAVPAVLPGGGQDPVHTADAAQVAAVIEQDRPRLGGGLVGEPVTVEHVEHVRALLLRQRSRMRRPRRILSLSRGSGPGIVLPVQRGPGFPEQAARCFH